MKDATSLAAEASTYLCVENAIITMMVGVLSWVLCNKGDISDIILLESDIGDVNLPEPS